MQKINKRIFPDTLEQSEGLIVFTNGQHKGEKGVYYGQELHNNKRMAAIYLLGEKKGDIVIADEKDFEECYEKVVNYRDYWQAPRYLSYGPVTVLHGEYEGIVGYYDGDEWVNVEPVEEYEVLEPFARILVGNYKDQKFVLVPHLLLLNIDTLENEKQIREFEKIRPGLAAECGFYRSED